MDTKPGPRSNRKPNASGRSAVGGLVAIDQTEARFAFVVLNVETNATAIGQLGMAT